VSRNSFISKTLSISPSVSIRYHQLIGNLIILGSVAHGAVSLYSWTLATENLSGYLLKKMNFGTNAKLISDWTIDDWKFPAAVFASVTLLLLRLFSLPIVRRSKYELFLVSHFLLAIPMLIMAKIHAKSSMILTLISLSLYITDLIYRLISHNNTIYAKISKECGNIVRMEVQGGAIEEGESKSKNGLFYEVRVKKISKLFSHQLR
jgi:hypothetical protein